MTHKWEMSEFLFCAYDELQNIKYELANRSFDKKLEKFTKLEVDAVNWIVNLEIKYSYKLQATKFTCLVLYTFLVTLLQ